ncbi:DUF2510 domain-containing protein (plasmid) [Gordonia sp. 135]|uniref:DUF2510 domain-containing protein n=1 Tax=Gordonia sp. 135 TaxID=2676309 RepID=UPI0012BB2C0E|nr:DUF2510 domain-containing protein [Gordonia sp. 135]
MTSGPGWFEDPEDPRRVRWWDGTQWTTSTNPALPAGHESQPPAKILKGKYRWVLVTILALLAPIVVLVALVEYLTPTKGLEEPRPDRTPQSMAEPSPSYAATRSLPPKVSPPEQSRTDTPQRPAPQTPQPPPGAAPALEPGTRMCQLGASTGTVYYLYLISKNVLDFSACNNSPTIDADGYSIMGKVKPRVVV